jgi:hypothetical protein
MARAGSVSISRRAFAASCRAYACVRAAARFSFASESWSLAVRVLAASASARPSASFATWSRRRASSFALLAGQLRRLHGAAALHRLAPQRDDHAGDHDRHQEGAAPEPAVEARSPGRGFPLGQQQLLVLAPLRLGGASFDERNGRRHVVGARLGSASGHLPARARSRGRRSRLQLGRQRTSSDRPRRAPGDFAATRAEIAGAARV